MPLPWWTRRAPHPAPGAALACRPLDDICRRVDTLADLAACRDDAVWYGPPAAPYLRPPPLSVAVDERVHAERLAPKLDKMTRLSGAPARPPRPGVARLNDVLVHDAGTITLASGCVVADSAEKMTSVPSLAVSAGKDGLRWSWDGAVPDGRPKDDALLLRKANDGNYGHWLLEGLPRLACGLSVRPRAVLTPPPEPGSAAMAAIHRDSLAAAGVAPSVQRPLPPQPVRFRRLWWPTPVNRVQEADADHLNDFSPVVREQAVRLRDRLGGVPERRRRLFVSRADAGHNVAVNEAEILEVLEPLGFERIVATGLSFAAQVRLFAEAEVVIGAVGAALCNLVFCAADTTVLLLTSERRSGHWYWDLCCLSGLRCHLLYGPVVDDARLRDAFLVDPGLLRAWTARWL